MLIRILAKELKVKIEKHPVTAEAKNKLKK